MLNRNCFSFIELITTILEVQFKLLSFISICSILFFCFLQVLYDFQQNVDDSQQNVESDSQDNIESNNASEDNSQDNIIEFVLLNLIKKLEKKKCKETFYTLLKLNDLPT